MRKKRLPCLLLALGMLLSLLGCSGTAADADSNQIYDELADYYQQKNKDKDVSISSFALPYLQGLTLDPVTCGDGTQQDIGCLLYEGLVQLDLEMPGSIVELRCRQLYLDHPAAQRRHLYRWLRLHRL